MVTKIDYKTIETSVLAQSEFKYAHLSESLGAEHFSTRGFYIFYSDQGTTVEFLKSFPGINVAIYKLKFLFSKPIRFKTRSERLFVTLCFQV